MKKERRFALTAKLNTMIFAVILLLSVVLLFFGFEVYSQRVDSVYNERMEDALRTEKLEALPVFADYFWQMIDTQEFRDVREQAIEANDPQIIADWMYSKPSVMTLYPDVGNSVPRAGGVPREYKDLYETADYLEEIYMPRNIFRTMTAEEEEPSLYLDYDTIYTVLGIVKEIYHVESLYVQFERNHVTYNIADPDEDLFYIGSIEERLKEFAGYDDNAEIPPTTYHMDGNWLRTTCRPLVTASGSVVGTLGVDIDMNDVVVERNRFLNKSISFVLGITAAVMIVSMLAMRHLATRPLKELAKAATKFGRDDDALSKKDILKLDIRSNDEIGDLYREIQSMQRRIVDYMENLARITAERERVRTEMNMAENLQISMLPDTFPAFPDHPEFELYASMNPARTVGGDFYDFFLIDDDHLALVIADVSDKGLPAALFMMAAKILINYRAKEGGTPAEILSDVNNHACRNSQTKMFVTVWLGILDLRDGRMICANAGHEYPELRGEDGVFHQLKDKHGFVVGGMEDAVYRDYELTLSPGDAIFVYTDGVTDANNPEGEFYGVERMEAVLNRLGKKNPESILSGLKKDVDRFVGTADQFDDLTMLCLEYKGKSGKEKE